MRRYKIDPILTPEVIAKLHRELSDQSRKTIDDMADYMGDRYCELCKTKYPNEEGCLKRERAREIIYVLVYLGYL